MIYLEVYDPTLDKWTILDVMSGYALDSVKLVANNGKLWFFGKRIVETIINRGKKFYVTNVYDPACDQWTLKIYKPHLDIIKAIGMIPFF